MRWLFNSKKVKDAAKELKIEDRGRIKVVKKYNSTFGCEIKVIYRCKNYCERLRVFIKDEKVGIWCWKCKALFKGAFLRFGFTASN